MSVGIITFDVAESLKQGVNNSARPADNRARAQNGSMQDERPTNKGSGKGSHRAERVALRRCWMVSLGVLGMCLLGRFVPKSSQLRSSVPPISVIWLTSWPRMSEAVTGGKVALSNYKTMTSGR